MDCNKDEAVRAKEIAENKLLERDITGAKKFALKAQNLFSDLDGLSQLLEVIEVHVADEKKINGEVDHYGILGVDPSADSEVLKRQYKRMALSLHPDKNKSVGAEGAFKILSQAWSILSNKDTRSAYDLKLKIRASNQTSSFSSSSGRYTTPATYPQNVPAQQSTPWTTSSQPCSSASHHPRNTHMTNSKNSPCHQRNPRETTASAPCNLGKSTLGTSAKHSTATNSQHDPGPQHPVEPTSGTSSGDASGYQAPARTVECGFIPVPPHPRNPTPPNGSQHSSYRNHQFIPRPQKIPAAAFSAQYIPASGPTLHNQFIPFRNQPTSSACPSRPETFWTSCNTCRIHYEYQKIYLYQNLLCPHCQKPFLAAEMPAPNLNSRSSCSSPIPYQQSMATPSYGSRRMPPFKIRTSQAPSCQPSGEHTKRKHEMAVDMGRDKNHLMRNNSCTVPENVETEPALSTVSSGLNREQPLKKRRKDGQKCDGSKEGSQGTTGVKRASTNVKGYFGGEQQTRGMKELSQFEVRVMLMRKAKTEILRRLNEWETEKTDSSHLKKVEMRNSFDAVVMDPVDHPRKYKRKEDLSSDPNTTSQPHDTSILEETNVDANDDEAVSMIVPDANFYNFDRDRIEESFTQGQVWAAYDDDDGMPRYYALVHHVLSRSPFKMQISWLNSKSTSEFGSLDWMAFGFTKTVGDFRIGKSVVNKRLNSFSHPVKWKKGAKGVIQIFPTKGEVWALFKNWSPDWNETTEDEKIHKYDLVVVLQDYSEDIGVSVASLVKVAGFTSVFKQLSDDREFWTIPREEMFRFSHQVPFYMLNGLEAENAPKDCYELDPAALPLELLKVTTDAESAESRVSEHSAMLGASGNESQPRIESTSSGITHTHEGRSSAEDVKYLLKYSRRKKGRKIEGDVGHSQ